MKVLSYLQFVLYEFNPENLEAYMIALGIWNTDFVAHKKRTEYLSNYDLYNIAQANYLDWCSQPFKPEMIVGYFEGWEKVKDNYHGGYYRNVNIQVEFYGLGFTIDHYHNRKPRTLDDFINDCQRAGIELEGRTK